jgi:hypothetical protein
LNNPLHLHCPLDVRRHCFRRVVGLLLPNDHYVGLTPFVELRKQRSAVRAYRPPTEDPIQGPPSE